MQADSRQHPAEYNFKSAMSDFQKLKLQNALPLKMLIKLQYLQNKILNRPINTQEYKELPQYELQSLEQCDKVSQTTLFVSIVKCLSGKEVIVYFNNTKAYIKKQEAFSIWTKCYVSCDSSYLYVKKKAEKKNNYYQFKIRLLKVSKKYLEYKSKVCFGLMYQNKKYMLGFEQETACERIFKTLRQLVRQNQPERPLKQGLNGTKSQQLLKERGQKSDKFESVINQNVPGQQALKLSFHSCNGPKSLTNQPKSPSHLSDKSCSVLQFQQDDQYEQVNVKSIKQADIYEAIKQQLKRQTISSDTNYKLIKNLDLGRLLVYNGPGDQLSREAKTKTSIILSMNESRVDYSWLLEQYLSMKSWNLEIEECKIIHKVSNNSYKMYLQFKKYSLLSLTRWAIVIITGVIIDKKVYLLIRSCEELTEEEIIMGNYMSTVKMKRFEQTVEIYQRPEKDDKILMTIVTVADFGGYCSKADNLNMSLQVLGNMQNFYNFLLTQAISKDYEGDKVPLFELAKEISSQFQTPCKSESKFTDSSASRSQISNISKRKQSYNSEVSAQSVDVVFEEQENQREIPFSKKKNPILMKENLSQIKVSSHNQAEQILQKEFLKEFQTFQKTERGTQKLVEFIQSKIQQKIYYKKKFIQHHTYDTQALKYNDDPVSDNWLLQKGKWRVSGLELIFTNEQILAQQKNVIKLILKQLSTNVMSGKNIMNMSLPVEIFQNKSFLQKLGEVYGYFPHFFNLAAKQKNIAKQITYVAQAVAFATTICPNIEKPFNPILGQTYQCSIGGISLCFQQTSHHPPISSFYIKTAEYQCYGSHNPSVQMGLNTAVAKNIAPIYVHFFQTNTKYTAYGQDFEVGGLIFGNRTYKNSGKVNVFEEKNQILCELSYGKNKKHIYQSSKKIKTGQIIGGVFKVSNAFTKRFHHAQWKHFQGIKYDQKIEQLAKITGNWMGDFYVDNVKMKGMYDIAPFKPAKQIHVLPSDCSFRLDVYYKKMGDMKKSQEWKEVMQNLQRKDRKIRQENSKQHPRKH